MPTGKIKWFNNAKGWGFITPDKEGNDIFLHYSAVLGRGYKKLKTGQRVNYATEERENGIYAIEVVLLPCLSSAGKSTEHNLTNSINNYEKI